MAQSLLFTLHEVVLKFQLQTRPNFHRWAVRGCRNGFLQPAVTPLRNGPGVSCGYCHDAPQVPSVQVHTHVCVRSCTFHPAKCFP